MDKPNFPRGLLAHGALIRADAIQSQIALGHTLCATAALSIAAGHFDHAHRILLKLSQALPAIQRHLGKTQHLPASVLPQLRLALQRLQERVVEIDDRLRR